LYLNQVYTCFLPTLLNGVATGAPVSGTGGALSFGNQTAAGVYTVKETITLLPAGTSCSPTTLTGSLTVSIDANVTPANAGPPQTVCATATMAGNTPLVGTGLWTLVSGSGTITTPTSPTTTVTVWVPVQMFLSENFQWCLCDS
jgi:hypothetical protein